MANSELLEYMLTHALCAGIEAGKSIMRIYNNDENYNVNLKADNTVIIEADKVSHETIRRELSKTRVPLMSEEGRNISFEERYSWDLYWLVDPIDGTLEFVKKNNEFSICISLVEDNTPVIGVIVAPAFGHIYYSIKGKGAYRLEGIDFSDLGENNITDILSKGIKLSCDTKHPSEGVKVFTTLSHPNAETDDIIKRMSEKYEIKERISCGSALKFCRMSEGAGNLYFRTTPLQDWDTAAGELIAVESGLTVKTLTGEPLKYNKKDLIIEPFVVSYHNIME